MELLLWDGKEIKTEMPVEKIIAIVHEAYPQIPEETIKTEAVKMAAWLESRPPKKRWKPRGLKKGILNWFSNVANSHKFSHREPNESKVKDNPYPKQEKPSEAKYGLDVVDVDKFKEMVRLIDVVDKIVNVLHESKLTAVKNAPTAETVKAFLIDEGIPEETVDYWLSGDLWREVDRIETELREKYGERYDIVFKGVL